MRRTSLAIAATLLLTGLGVGVAANANATSNASVGSGVAFGAREYENSNESGAVLTIYVYSQCTSTSLDVDYSFSTLPTGWNDVISSTRDYNQCDQYFYTDTHFNGDGSGWVNGGSAGVNITQELGQYWNDSISSIRLS